MQRPAARIFLSFLADSARVALLPLAVLAGGYWHQFDQVSDLLWVGLAVAMMLVVGVVFTLVSRAYRRFEGRRTPTRRPFLWPSSKNHTFEFLGSLLGSLILASYPVVDRLWLRGGAQNLAAAAGVGVVIGIAYYFCERSLIIAAWRFGPHGHCAGDVKA